MSQNLVKTFVKVIWAIFQAVAVIAQGLLSREYSVAFGNDSDFSFFSPWSNTN
jgi:hypothetical protein